MQSEKQDLIEALNDLVKINYDRVEGYENVLKDSIGIDQDLKDAFHIMAQESRKYANELNQQIRKLGGRPSSDTTISGTIYFTWLKVKAAFAGSKNAEDVLSICEHIELSAEKAYQNVLELSIDIPAGIRELIALQKSGLKQSYDIIKKHRKKMRSLW